MTTRAKVALGLGAAAITAFLVSVAALGASEDTHSTDALMGMYHGPGMEGYMTDLPSTGLLQTAIEKHAYADTVSTSDTYQAISQSTKAYADDWSRMLPWLMLIGGIGAAGAGQHAAHLRRQQGFGIAEQLPDVRRL